MNVNSCIKNKFQVFDLTGIIRDLILDSTLTHLKLAAFYHLHSCLRLLPTYISNPVESLDILFLLHSTIIQMYVSVCQDNNTEHWLSPHP